MSDVTKDPWARLRACTPARIALGRAGASLPTREVLALSLAHARARDAVHAPFDAERVARGLTALGLEVIGLESEARDRALYLRRPDQGGGCRPPRARRWRSVRLRAAILRWWSAMACRQRRCMPTPCP